MFSPQSPVESAPKKPRLQDARGTPPCDRRGEEDENADRSPLMQPLFPTLMSTLGVDDPFTSSPAPLYDPPSSPTQHLSTTRKLKFMKPKPFEYVPRLDDDPRKAVTFGGSNQPPFFLAPSSSTGSSSHPKSTLFKKDPQVEDASIPMSRVTDAKISSKPSPLPTAPPALDGQTQLRNKTSARKNPFARKEATPSVPPQDTKVEVKRRGIPDVFRPKAKQRREDNPGRDEGSRSKPSTKGVSRDATPFMSTAASGASSSRLPPGAKSSRPNPNSQKPPRL
ncbi:hypothetical protein MD484_g7296, partial [Candolleomyces efflorescens]